MNYVEAKSFCREMYTDLATIHNSVEMNNLIALAPSNIDRAWIGLEIVDVKMWHWSWPDQKLDYFNWETGEPQNKNEDTCAAMNPSGKWFETGCENAQSFVCHGNGGTGGPIFVAGTKSWREAQNHCREVSSDLVSIHSAEENEMVHNMTQSRNVWTGLFGDRWIWSDGSNSSFRYWKPNRPNNFETQHCIATILKDEGQWNNRRCSGNQRFFCQDGKYMVFFLKML
ncbi:hypothetical protein LDENG_00132710 [Lucifuga dentata]|nr:hypothetical protein LDENG_00132710 [Lucifuga dentata]